MRGIIGKVKNIIRFEVWVRAFILFFMVFRSYVVILCV